MFDMFWRAIAIGIGATVAMDLWAIFLHKAFGQPRPNWGPVGRWVWHLRDKVFHDDIGGAAPYAHEKALGWAFHYFVGIVYGIILVVLAGAGWLAAPTFLPAFILGIVTVGAGWFLLAPGMGAGLGPPKAAPPEGVRGGDTVLENVFWEGGLG
ncbi:DUF2938 family protein [Mesorhizobium sp. M0098]|uniref:DUF2938 family protein n=1 Tax=Mesorhizobium sp. M0098 TaxID=2956878 RepID=UPI00333A31C7